MRVHISIHIDKAMWLSQIDAGKSGLSDKLTALYKWILHEKAIDFCPRNL